MVRGIKKTWRWYGLGSGRVLPLRLATRRVWAFAPKWAAPRGQPTSTVAGTVKTRGPGSPNPSSDDATSARAASASRRSPVIDWTQTLSASNLPYAIVERRRPSAMPSLPR